jgi:hypothetical protein
MLDVERASVVSDRATRILADSFLRVKVQSLTERIPHQPAVDPVHAELYRYFMAPAAIGESDEEAVLHRPLKKLTGCFPTEALVQLNLAVGKAQCLEQMPPVASYGAAQEWIRSGWKSCKAWQCSSSTIAMEQLLVCSPSRIWQCALQILVNILRFHSTMSFG